MSTETTPSGPPANDGILDGFLGLQVEACNEINADSEIVNLLAEPASLPRRYIARFDCQTFVRNPGEEPKLYTGPIDIGIHFHSDYLRKPSMAHQVFTLLQPTNVFHPNVRGPGICTTIHPGTTLPGLVFTLWTLLTFRKSRPQHPFNRDAAAWCRRNQNRFPTDQRALRGRPLTTAIEFSEIES